MYYLDEKWNQYVYLALCDIYMLSLEYVSFGPKVYQLAEPSLLFQFEFS